MSNDFVEINDWYKIEHSCYAPSKKLYDPYWVEGSVFNIQKKWLETKMLDYGFDSVSDLVYYITQEQAAKIISEAISDSVANRPYLYYLYSIKNPTFRNLVKDAYTIRDMFDWLTPDAIEEHKEEYDDCKDILTKIENNIYGHLTIKYSIYSKENLLNWYDSLASDTQYVYIDFLTFGTLERVKTANIKDMYLNLYKLYDFFLNVEQPKKKSAQHEYDYCKKLLKAIEIAIIVRLGGYEYNL